MVKDTMELVEKYEIVEYDETIEKEMKKHKNLYKKFQVWSVPDTGGDVSYLKVQFKNLSQKNKFEKWLFTKFRVQSED
jgi:hypothetical protein